MRAPEPATADPQPDVDFDNPAERFVVLSFLRIKGVAQATILDQKLGIRSKVVEGDSIDEYRVARIDMTKRTVQLRGAHFDTITLRLHGIRAK